MFHIQRRQIYLPDKSFSSIHSQLNENVLSTTNLNFYQDSFAFFSVSVYYEMTRQVFLFLFFVLRQLWSDNKEIKK